MGHTTKLFLPVFILFVFGLIMIFNATSAELIDHFQEKKAFIPLLRQIFYGIFGVGVGFLCYKLKFENALRLSPLLLAIFTVLLALVFVPYIGMCVNGSRRWLRIFGMSFQPSEFVKFIIPLYFVYSLPKICKNENPLFPFLKVLASLFLPIILILLEPNNGTCAVIGIELIVLCFLARIPLKYWALPIAILCLFGGIVAFNTPYVRSRLNVWLHPENDIRGKGHQPLQAKIASGSGGFFGKGSGKSVQKLSYLPEAQNDYIAAIYAEEFGFVGIIVLCLLYTWFGMSAFHIANQSLTTKGLFVATIFSFILLFQAFLNLAVVSGLVPSTGLNLPFFSQGGTSLIANCSALGLLLSIAHEPKALEEENL